jgi:hypothetical protein
VRGVSLTKELNSLLTEVGDRGHSLRVPEAGMIGLAKEFYDLYAAYLETPRSFLYLSFLTYLGTLIAKKVTLASELEVEPRLYVVVVGESADTRKSTALHKADVFSRSVSPGFPVIKGVGSAEGAARALNSHGGYALVALRRVQELRG